MGNRNMTFFKRAMALAAILCAASAWGVSPRVGYAYPAGGVQGKTVQVLLGGQFLNGVSGVRVSGEGVQGTVLQYGKPFNNKQLMELRKQVTVLLKARRAGDNGKTLASLLANSEAFLLSKVAPLPEHPLLRNLDGMSLKELEYWAALYSDVKKRQINPQLAEMVLVEITMDSGAAPGWRELRLVTPAGLTNPLNFHIGNLRELKETEPNDQAPSMDTADPPVVLNGQIFQGDRDRFSIRARRGQKLVMQVDARRLVPYLADAVPGWFQSVLTVYDSSGKEVAFADDYRFDPDPALLCEIPADGEYTVEIHDALYRGRDDFVYRITVGALPFVTQLYPLGGQAGEKSAASISGWNIEKTRLALNTDPGAAGLRQTALVQNGLLSNNFSYAVDALPECMQKEPNDGIAKAQKIKLPTIVNGIIERPDDVDVFKFEARSGDRVVAEVCARRLGSPLDSLLRLMDASGKVIEWNDDHEDKETGLITHQADSYLCAELKENGEYFLQLSDTQHNGGPAYGYRLRVGAPRPDFALRVTPSCINVGTGRDAVVSVCALRRDGFEGPIDLALKDMPPGFGLKGAQIPAGRESMRLTLRAPKKAPDAPLPLHIEGRAEIDGSTVCQDAAPAEDMMQAFLYRHLVPAQEMLVAVTNSKQPAPPVSLTPKGTVRIPLGGTAQVLVNTPPRPMLANVRLVLSDPPKGVSLEDVTVVPEGLQFTLKAESGDVGYKDNLIVQVFVESEGQQKDGKPAKQKQRNELGPLPAVPIEIVQP
jgi:hypothetical protein